MKQLLRRQVVGYALGLITAVAGFTVGAAWARSSAGNTIEACVQKGSDRLYIEPAKGCAKGDTPLAWSITGPQGPQGIQGIQGPKGDKGDRGPAGSLAGKIVSSNGMFTVDFGNLGITLKGPQGSVVVDVRGAHMNTIGSAP